MSAVKDAASIDQVLSRAVESGAVPHVVAIAADRDGVIYQGAAGPRAVDGSDPVSADTVFRIMSMTKMPCTVLALQEMEKGTLDLDAPVVNYCPEFAEVQGLTWFDNGVPPLRPPAPPALDAAGFNYYPEFAEAQVRTGFDNGLQQLRPPASPATVRQLITHTS